MAPTVLVVDDEPRIRQLYASWLDDEYDVVLAGGGEEALATADGSVDVVLLDRRMPDYSGDEVLETLRERGNDAWVVMATAVDPDVDVVDMPFDDYLVKPIERSDLFDAVEGVLAREEYEPRLREYFELTAKLGALEAAKSERELSESDEYARLKAEYLETKERLAGAAERLRDRDGYDELFLDLPSIEES